MITIVLLSTGLLLVVAWTASAQLQTDVFEKVKIPPCSLQCLEIVYARDLPHRILMCKSACQFSMFYNMSGYCNLSTDGDTEECDDTYDFDEYVYII
ncbi:hypothetical protein DPMN_128106 [Dreissena polymorpha]|uniref:Uncharacterized protein n=1 Tax=Dreissena polymorpha TaxID=45954 RepID=A0A9D4H066_DREPO|nr:hypothetical protein DPMN_128106 [Dreissena polymorpha]